MARDHQHFALDRLGMALSAICLLHCLVPPFLVVAFPILSAVGAYEYWVHLLLAVFILPVAFKAIAQGYKHHGKAVVPIFAIAGASLFVISTALTVLGESSHNTEHAGIHFSAELGLSIAGSLLISLAHGLNIWFCRPKFDLVDQRA